MSDVIAVDLGGTNIRAARVDRDGRIIAREKTATQAKRGMSEVVDSIATLVNSLKTPQTVAVGVGTPGVPDPKTGVMRLKAVAIPGSDQFPLSSTLQQKVNLPVVADNDGNLAALGEAWLGAGKGEHVVLIFTLGTGIGGGVVIDGKVYHGDQNLVAEFGHASIDFRGRPCPCGNIGCVERYASASALGNDARTALRDNPEKAKHSALLKLCGSDIEKVDARMVCNAARDGDAFAQELFEQYCVWLACGVGSQVNSFNPSCVIFGGGLALAGEMLIAGVHKHLAAGRAFGPIYQCCKLCLAVLGDDAGLLGSARNAFQSVGLV